LRKTQLGGADLSSEGAETVPVDPRQLAFDFSKTRRKMAFPATTSRRVTRTQTVGRVARLPLVDRPLEEIRLERAVSVYLPPGKSLRLVLTDNRYNIVAIRRDPNGYMVRIHRVFVDAGPRLIRAMARYIVHNDRRASLALGEFIKSHLSIIKKSPRRPRTVKLRPEGRHHNLKDIFDGLNERYFGGSLQASITWGSSMLRAQQRSMKMGSFSVEDRIIRVHPALDRADVPRFFVEWIVFHEMLHGRQEIRRKGGRRCFHTPEFVAMERQFADYERASAWEKQHADKLFHPS